MKRASYRDAIFFLAANDDTDWLTVDAGRFGVSVSAALVASIFDVEEERVARDVRREIEKIERNARADGRRADRLTGMEPAR